MIILVNPMWSVEHLNKDSNYVHIKKVIERYTEMYPNTYFIIKTLNTMKMVFLKT
jgi:hypothetical protein